MVASDNCQNNIHTCRCEELMWTLLVLSGRCMGDEERRKFSSSSQEEHSKKWGHLRLGAKGPFRSTGVWRRISRSSSPTPLRGLRSLTLFFWQFKLDEKSREGTKESKTNNCLDMQQFEAWVANNFSCRGKVRAPRHPWNRAALYCAESALP